MPLPTERREVGAGQASAQCSSPISGNGVGMRCGAVARNWSCNERRCLWDAQRCQQSRERGRHGRGVQPGTSPTSDQSHASIWSNQIGETVLLPAPKLTRLYRTPSQHIDLRNVGQPE